ncbi:MAG: hypothetical protein C0464_03460 [Cyanobacteria bacterium DS2.008]|nr:hypothetical protein [Cyanobacteria bacterium DS2.008]
MQTQHSMIIEEPTVLYPTVSFFVDGDKLYLINRFHRSIIVSVDIGGEQGVITYDLQPGAKVKMGTIN